MSFSSGLFRSKEKPESVVLIDIGTDSVAGAYAYSVPGEQPILLYTQRLPIEAHGGESPEDAMLRALHVLGDVLIREGAPELVRVTGSGKSDSILVSVDAPWQKTSVRTEHLEQQDPFMFTRKLAKAALEKTSTVPSGHALADESIIGTILNGYETRDPYGKQARRASIVILTSCIDERVADSIRLALRGLYHTNHIVSIAGTSLRYQAMRTAFPHERDVLILDATGPLTSVALVRRDLLVAVTQIESRTTDTTAWLQKVADELAELANRFPLPRTIFLLAREPEITSLRETLDRAGLGKLWLSDSPPKIVSVLAGHIIDSVRQTAVAPPDLSLLLMALYWKQRALGK